MIDGHLDEAVWANAATDQPFVQRSPDPGMPPQHATQLRVLASHDHVYVGMRMDDSDPDAIRQIYGRRDTALESDRATVYLDPLGTGQRAFYFTVNAAGVLTDGIIYNQTQRDLSWDAIWRAAVSIDARGWTAEFEIPLQTIPFQDGVDQSWRFYAERFRNQSQELSGWPFIPPAGNAFVSVFGTLAGLRNMRRPSVLRIQPYAAASAQLSDVSAAASSETFTPNAGLDLRIGVTPRLRLVLALNPDFGEVDQDPDVVNLGPTEVFLIERRPFFSAGLDVFRTPSPPSKAGQFLFLNTRRMGGRAPSVRAGPGGVVVQSDSQRRILGALTALGEAGRHTSLGLMTVLEAPSRAITSSVNPVRGSVVVSERETAPWTHYGVLRARRRFGGRSYVGFMGTTVNRIGETDVRVQPSGELTADTDAFVGLMDWEYRTAAGGQFVGFLSASHSRSGTGFGSYLQLGKLGFRKWTYKLELETYTGGYDINDLGFLPRSDHTIGVFRVDRQLTKPLGPFRSGGFALTTLQSVRFADFTQPLQRRFRFDAYTTLQSNWRLSTALGYNAPVVDELETRGGPVFPRPHQIRWDLRVGTDASRVAWSEWRNRVEWEGGGFRLRSNLTTSAVILDRLVMALQLGWRGNRTIPRYITTVEDRGAPQYIIGDLDYNEFQIQLTATLGITRKLTLQTFAQLLWGVGHYARYRELVRNENGDMALVHSNYLLGAPEEDFVRASFSANTVLRFDLGGGTAALLSYRVVGALSVSGSSSPFDFDESFFALSQRGFQQRLLLKISYAWSAL